MGGLMTALAAAFIGATLYVVFFPFNIFLVLTSCMAPRVRSELNFMFTTSTILIKR